MKKYLLLILTVAFGYHLIAQEVVTDTIGENTTLPTIIMIDTDYDDS